METIKNSGVDNRPVGELVQLPTFEEFVELIESDNSLDVDHCKNGYGVHAVYKDGAVW